MTTAVDLGDLTKGDAGSLIIGSSTVHSAEPVVAALRITRGKGSKQEFAFLPATALDRHQGDRRRQPRPRARRSR